MCLKQVMVEINSGVDIKTSIRVTLATSKYRGDISIVKANAIANARNIFDLLSMELRKGDEIVIIADGRDEKMAVDAVEEVLLSGLLPTAFSKDRQKNGVCNCNQEEGCHGCTNCQSTK